MNIEKMSIGEILKEYRMQKGIPLRVVANITGTTISSLSMFENGSSKSARLFAYYVEYIVPYEDWEAVTRKYLEAVK